MMTQYLYYSKLIYRVNFLVQKFLLESKLTILSLVIDNDLDAFLPLWKWIEIK